MRWLWLCGWWVVALSAQAEGIAEVLQRSQQQRLAQREAPEAGSAAAARVRASFDRLLALLPPQAPPPVLQLVGGTLFAEAVFGRQAVAVSESAGELPEGERLLMLAHELGHLQLGHWPALRGLYLQHIPGEVRPETTDPVAARLGAEAHALSHRHEYEADAFGYTLVRQLGYGVDSAFGLLGRLGVQADSATHPGTRRRLALLRALDARLAQPGLAAGEASSLAAGR